MATHRNKRLLMCHYVSIQRQLSDISNDKLSNWSHSHWIRTGCPGGRSSSFGRSKIFLVSTAFRSVLGPTQFPIERVSGVMRPGRVADQSSPTSTKVKNTWMYTSTPSWHTAQLSTGIRFCFTFYVNLISSTSRLRELYLLETREGSVGFRAAQGQEYNATWSEKKCQLKFSL
jgi:hypothetical protein